VTALFKKRILNFVVYPIIGIYLGLLIILYIFQDKIIFHGRVLEKNLKFPFKVPFKELWLKSEKNLYINGIHFYTNNREKKGIVVYLHGNAHNLVRWGKHSPEFTKNGYDVIMIDYRSFGKSKGSFSEKGLINDARAAYNYAKGLFPENKIVLYGRSLGTGIATQIATENNPKQLLLETPYLNLPDVAAHYFPFIPFKNLTHYQFPTDKLITKVKCPIHLFHGTDDQLVYYESSLKLCEILGKKPDEILTTIPHGRHKNLAEFEGYHRSLDSCLVQ
jgi:uncharacterized protein